MNSTTRKRINKYWRGYSWKYSQQFRVRFKDKFYKQITKNIWDGWI